MILMLWRTFNIKHAVINNYFRFFFFVKSLLILLSNDLLDYLIEYDGIHNSINLFFWGPFSQISKNRAYFPQKKGWDPFPKNSVLALLIIAYQWIRVLQTNKIYNSIRRYWLFPSTNVLSTCWKLQGICIVVPLYHPSGHRLKHFRSFITPLPAYFNNIYIWHQIHWTEWQIKPT